MPTVVTRVRTKQDAKPYLKPIANRRATSSRTVKILETVNVSRTRLALHLLALKITHLDRGLQLCQRYPSLAEASWTVQGFAYRMARL
jgi:hypothetical protein